MSLLGNEGLKLPTQQMQSRSTGVGIHRRAYASIEVIGGNPNVKCGDTGLKIESNVSKKHSSMFSTEGGRLTPQPMLDSVSISNDGGQDLSDAMLFQADVKLKCWNKSDFDKIEKSFMTPGMRCLIKLGWVGGDTAKVKGDVTGFNFSINSDLSFDITIKVGGIMEGILNADFTTLKDLKPIEYEDKESGEKVTATDIVSQIVGAHANADFKPNDGKANGAAGLGRANHQMERSGFFSYFTSNDNVMDYVSLGLLIKMINENSKGVGSTAKEKFDLSNFTPGNISKLASGNPLKLIVSYYSKDAKYGAKADYSGLSAGGGLAANLWLSVPGLVEIYEGLTNPPGAENERVVATTTFLKKIFQMIKDFTGGALQPFLYSDPDKDKMFILNRGTAVSSGAISTISVVNGYKNGIRDLTLTSNLDSELMAMATTAAQTGQGGEALQKIYPGCFEPRTDFGDIEKEYDDAIAALGDTISETDIQTAKQAIKKYVNAKYRSAAPTISYGLDCTLTCDGYFGPTFGQSFTVDRLPSRMKNSTFFVVTKLGQNFSNGDWTTEITGTMMISQ